MAQSNPHVAISSVPLCEQLAPTPVCPPGVIGVSKPLPVHSFSLLSILNDIPLTSLALFSFQVPQMNFLLVGYHLETPYSARLAFHLDFHTGRGYH